MRKFSTKRKAEVMNQEKFMVFSRAYEKGLHEAVIANPKDYARCAPGRGGCQRSTPETFAKTVSARMLDAISSKPYAVNYNGDGFKRACKALGIKHTRKAIFDYLEIES
jgi:hypothetical protein